MTLYHIKPQTYYSFLLRLRCLEGEEGAVMRITLEHVDTPRTEYFASLAALVEYLQGLVVIPAPPPPGGDKGTLNQEV